MFNSMVICANACQYDNNLIPANVNIVNNNPHQ